MLGLSLDLTKRGGKDHGMRVYTPEVAALVVMVFYGGSYPWAIGPVLTLVCELSFAGWFVAVGSQLFRMRGSAA
jgi:hypothetical protein